MRSAVRAVRVAGFLAVLIAVLAPAQQAPVQGAVRKALLWKATSPTATVYLLGSVHLAEKDLYPLAPPVEKAFADSKVLLVEVNVKKYSKEEMAAMVQSRALYADGSTLSQHIGKPTSDALDVFCEANSVPRAALEPMKPWMVSTLVSLLPLEKAGISTDQGIDIHFMNSVGPQQRIEELETIEAQFDLLALGSATEQEEALMDSLKQAPKAIEHLHVIQAAFLNGDPEGVRKWIEETSTGPKSLRKRLLDDRNAPMADKIERYLKGNEPVFVVVGAAHLVGEESIVSILRRKNYKIEQVAIGN